jgi:hypothetical protein
MKHIQLRDGRWCIVRSCWQAWARANGTDTGVGENCNRRLDDGSGIGAGYLFRPVNRDDQVCGDRLSDIVVWQMLKAYVAEIGIPNLAPHDLRRHADDPIMPNLCKDERTMEANEDAGFLTGRRSGVHSTAPIRDLTRVKCQVQNRAMKYDFNVFNHPNSILSTRQ